MDHKLICVIVVFTFVLTGFSSAASTTTSVGIDKGLSQDEEKIIFGDNQHLDKLSIRGILDKKDLGLYQNYKEKTISFQFDHSKCKSYKMGMRHVYVGIDGLEPSGSPGYPMLPMGSYTVDLPKNVKIIEVGIIGGFYNEIKNKVHIIPSPKPVFWYNPQTTARKDTFSNIIPNIKIYNSDDLFPGVATSYKVGRDNEKTQVFVKVYPIQYMPRSDRIFLLTNGTIKIYYSCDEGSSNPQLSKSNSYSNIIITPPSLYHEALKLKHFHDVEGLYTGTINTTWIYENYEEARDPPYPGYANQPYDNVNNYNYSLAKRILSYLNDTANHPKLQYVTLLGNARLVPPSYYYEWYSQWVPTDFFYSSPDYDLVPNYKIGRLPVNNSEEAAHVIDKIKNWNASSELFGNITVAGGKPFGTPYDIGEMITIDSTNQGLFRGIKPRKCFRTELSFDRFNLTRPLMGETGILYHIGHGSGDAWSLEGDPLGIKDIMSLPQSNTSPIVVSIACMDGAFDTHLVNMSFNVSFGESLLLSNAGGIAYIGGSRSNAGSPIFTLDRGYVNILKETYMAAMLTYVFEPFYNCTSTLGDLTTYATTRYVESHDFTDPLDNYTFFTFVLLGDPALKLPIRPTGKEYRTPLSQINDQLAFVDDQDLDRTVFTFFDTTHSGDISLNPVGENMTCFSNTDSPDVDIKIVDSFASNNVVVEKATMSTINDNISFDFIPDKGSLYSIRTITDDGREGWLFAASARIVDDDYNDTTPGIGVTRWTKIQDAIGSSANSEIIYVFNGTYHENICLDKSVKVIGENNRATIIDGGGDGTVVSITVGSCSISDFSIINGGSQGGGSGLSIAADMLHMPLITNNIIENNSIGISIIGNCSSWCIYNEISNCSIGVYLKSNMLSSSLVLSNTIRDNDCGISLLDSNMQMVVGNEIISNGKCIHINGGGYSNFIYLNNITNSKLGIYLENTRGNMIESNNFIDNGRHAKFYKCTKNIWGFNYWDNPRILPKLIFGRAGIFGLIPWINIDPTPAKIPKDINAIL